MTILVVTQMPEQLQLMEKHLKSWFPGSEIRIETDPLMAGKYSASHKVDILIAELCMKRMDGLKMKEFVHHFWPEARVYLTGKREHFWEWNMTDEHGHIFEEGIEGVIFHPVTEEKLRAMLQWYRKEAAE